MSLVYVGPISPSTLCAWADGRLSTEQVKAAAKARRRASPLRAMNSKIANLK